MTKLKFLTFTITTALLLSACNVSKKEISVPETYTLGAYHIFDEHLYFEQNRVFDENIKEVMGSNFEDYSVWHTFNASTVLEDEKVNGTWVLIKGASGCEGCTWLMPKYFVVNNDTGEVKIKEYQDSDLSLFERGATGEVYNLMNPSEGTYPKRAMFPRLAVAKIMYLDVDEDTGKESVWYFTFLSGEKTLMADIEEGYSLVTGEDYIRGGHINTELIHWEAAPSLKMVIKVPHKKYWDNDYVW